MFWTDWSQTSPGIYRAFMDGTKHAQITGRGQVVWPNGVCIDYATDRIFWVDANLDYIASADLDGSNINILQDKTVRDALQMLDFFLYVKRAILKIHFDDGQNSHCA